MYHYKVMNTASRLTRILKSSKLSQEELARMLSVSFVTLNSWVNNRSTPRTAALLRIESLYLELFGVDKIAPQALVNARQQALRLRLATKDLTSNQKLLDRLILALTYHTNTIEGSTMTLADTEAVLFKGHVLKNRTQVEQLEATNHRAALLWLLAEIQKPGFRFTEDFILQIHTRLANGILSDAGEYRAHPVRIMGASVVVANYRKIPHLVAKLLDRFTRSTERDPIALMASSHAEFEQIHPFSDGNGRVGRLLMLALALRAGLVPPIILKERKFAYYKYLELAQTSEMFEPLEYFVCQSIEAGAGLLKLE